MRTPGMNGEGELRGQQLTQVYLKKMAIRMECVYMCVCCHLNKNTFSKLKIPYFYTFLISL